MWNEDFEEQKDDLRLMIVWQCDDCGREVGAQPDEEVGRCPGCCRHDA